MKAMIFAAGLGTRLGEITKTTSKALLELNGKSLLQIAVEKLSEHGFNDIIVNVHHFADRVKSETEKLRKKGYKISVSDEKDLLLETGGGLFKARWFFDENPFLLYNVDIITDLDLSSLYSFHKEKNGIATVAVKNRPDNRFFLINKSGVIRGWCNKATGEQIIAGKITEELNEIAFSGIHIVDPEIFNYMDEGVYSMTSLYLQLAADHNIFTFNHDESYWIDIGTSENLEEARKYNKNIY